MKIEITNRFTGTIIFEGDFSSLAEAVVASVRGKKNLYGAYLKGAYLYGANLEGACLKGANLEGANLEGFPDFPVIEKIDSKILEAIKGGGRLEMGAWHTCGTTHCRGGWAVHLAGEKGAALEKATNTHLAAMLIYMKSRKGPVPDFYASNDEAMADMKRCAAEEAAAK
jgi:hypothetical protein